MCVAVKLLCGLEASQGPVQEVLSSAGCVSPADRESSDELEPEDADENLKGSRKKKNKRCKGRQTQLRPPLLLLTLITLHYSSKKQKT